MSKIGRIARSSLVALVLIVAVPTIVYAAVVSGSSTSGTTAGVTGKNTSTTNGAKAIYGFESGSTGKTYGVFGRTASSAGFGVYSQGNLGISSGKRLSCTACVVSAAIASSARTRIVTTTTSSTDTIATGATCVNLSGGSISITAPGPGTIIVDADFGLKQQHTNGEAEEVDASVRPALGACGGFTPPDAFAQVPSEYPTAASVYTFLHIEQPFTVSSAGAHTYHLGAINYATTTATFWRAAMVAVFIPA